MSLVEIEILGATLVKFSSLNYLVRSVCFNVFHFPYMHTVTDFHIQCKGLYLGKRKICIFLLSPSLFRRIIDITCVGRPFLWRVLLSSIARQNSHLIGFLCYHYFLLTRDCYLIRLPFSIKGEVHTIITCLHIIKWLLEEKTILSKLWGLSSGQGGQYGDTFK